MVVRRELTMTSYPDDDYGQWTIGVLICQYVDGECGNAPICVGILLYRSL